MNENDPKSQVQTVDRVPQLPKKLLDFSNMLHGEVNGPDNAWFTGLAVGHPPTADELLVHYVCHGGLRNLKTKFSSSSN
jgi:hypothetical protein